VERGIAREDFAVQIMRGRAQVVSRAEHLAPHRGYSEQQQRPEQKHL
jgi:hypothetical protein